MDLLGLSSAGSRTPDEILCDFVRFPDRIETDAPHGGDLHVILDYGGELAHWKQGKRFGTFGRLRLHAYPLDSLNNSTISEAAAMACGARLDLDSTGALSDLISAMGSYMSADPLAAGMPFVWTKNAHSAHDNTNVCKIVLTAIRQVGSFIIDHITSDAGSGSPLRAAEGVVVKWMESFESWCAAAALAEEGCSQTALEAAEGLIPDTLKSVEIYPLLTEAFSKTAFGDKNCRQTAAVILSDAKRWASFMEAVGLTQARAWTGVAQFEESFAEAVALREFDAGS